MGNVTAYLPNDGYMIAYGEISAAKVWMKNEIKILVIKISLYKEILYIYAIPLCGVLIKIRYRNCSDRV